MATKYPDASWRPLGNQTQPEMSKHDIICLHTMVGYLTSTDTMFHANGYGGTESHFGIGGKWGGDVSKGYDGKVYQWQDLDHTADANFEGNHRVISIETADNAPQSANNLAGWTDKQLDSIVDLVVWLCKKYDIPPLLVRDSKPGRRGIAYHRLGIEHGDGVNSHPGWLVSGGERWSTSRGKMCPGDARIKQVNNIIIPRVQAIMNGELDMNEADVKRIVKEALTDDATVKTLATKLFAADVIGAPDEELAATPDNPTWAMRSYLKRVVARTADNPTDLAEIKRTLADILAKLNEEKA